MTQRGEIIRSLLQPPPATPKRRRGHAPKIAEAVAALRAEGMLPPHLRPCLRDKRIVEWLLRNGYRGDTPGRDAIRRWSKSEMG